jgi:pimeloyl-ACP methyl ester carboxylesterase
MTSHIHQMGDRTDAEGPFTLDRYADEVGKVADLLAKPTVIVGHSIGAPIAELVAGKRPDTSALVLIASVPLAGTHLPAEALASFSQAAGNAGAMRALIGADFAGARVEGHDQMAAVAAKVRPDAVKAIAEAWNNGHPDGNAPSKYRAPVLLLPRRKGHRSVSRLGQEPGRAPLRRSPLFCGRERWPLAPFRAVPGSCGAGRQLPRRGSGQLAAR